MTRRVFRNYIYRAHTWIGLHISVFLAFLFLTGAILVVALELQLVTQPKAWNTLPPSERTVTFGQIFDTVKAEHPLAAISVIEKRPRPWLASQVDTRMPWGETVTFWADPTDGTLVGASRTDGLHRFIRELHDNLLLKVHPVYLFVTSMSVILLVMIVTGLINYRRFWKGLFRWPSRQSTRRIWLGGAHRLMAVWALPLVLIIALTSFIFFLEGLGAQGSEPEPAQPMTRSAMLPDGFDGDTIDKAETVAREALPGFQPLVVLLPNRADSGLVFYGDHIDSPISLGAHRVVIDPANLDVLGAFLPAETTGLARIRPIVIMLHFGTWGGVFSRVLWICLGLAAFGVALTGALIFAARQSSVPTQASRPGSLRRIWRGLGITRWAYLLLVSGIIAAAAYTYSPAFERPVRLYPTEASEAPVQVLAEHSLREGTVYPLTLHVADLNVETATVQLNAGPPQPVALHAEDGGHAGRVEIHPEADSNTVLVRLNDSNGELWTLTYLLGRPVW